MSRRTRLHLRSNSHIIYVLIDNRCLQANIISAKIGSLLAKDGDQTYETNIVLTERVGWQSCRIHGSLNVTVIFKIFDEEETIWHICLRAMVYWDLLTQNHPNLGLSSILYCNLLPLLLKNMPINTHVVKFVWQIQKQPNSSSGTHTSWHWQEITWRKQPHTHTPLLYLHQSVDIWMSVILSPIFSNHGIRSTSHIGGKKRHYFNIHSRQLTQILCVN